MKKPNIEEVFNVFNKFKSNTSMVHTAGRFKAQAELFEKAQKEFREDMERIGLAEFIDWGD